MNNTDSTRMKEDPKSIGSHEPVVIQAWIVFCCGLGLLLTLGILLPGLRGFEAWLRSKRTPTHIPEASVETLTRANAALNPNQRQTRDHYEHDQRQKLNTYGWIDRKQQIVHIPIDEAMMLLVKRREARHEPSQ